MNFFPNKKYYLKFFLINTIASLLLISISISQPIRQNVILVIIDGARYSETLGDPTGQYIPRMMELSTQAAIVDTFLNDSLTYTSRAIPAIWCGSWAAPKDTIINGNATQYATVPTMWEYFRKDRNIDSTNAQYILKQLTAPWLPSYHPLYGPQYWPWYVMQDGYWSDLYVWQLAKLKLQTYHPQLAVIYLADVDAAGHSGNWNNYTRKITIADSIVGMIWDFIQTDSIYQNKTTMLVTNDHGRHLDGILNGFVSHGDGCWGCRRIQLLAIGSGVRKGISNIKRKITDITKTIGALLNYNSIFSTGEAMSEILKPIISFNKSFIDFGNVMQGESVTDSFKIYNSGGVPLLVNINTPSYFSVNPPSYQIPPHQSKNFTVTFIPSDTGLVNTFALISHNDENLYDTIKFLANVFISNRVTLNIKQNRGWNLLSIPIKTDQKQIDSLFKNISSQAFIYTDGYISTDTTNFGQGFWLKFMDSTTTTLTGTMVTTDTFDLKIGWNIIGTISVPVPISNILTIPPNIITTNFYSYNLKYEIVDTLKPGYGYWVKSNNNGKIILK